MFKKLFRSSFLHDLPLIYEDYFIRYRFGKLHLMGDDEHGLTLLCQIQHNIQHLSYHLRLQCCRYLIE